MNNQLIQSQVITRASNITELSSSLSALKPNNSEATQLITYTLMATAMVGIFVYHYIKEQEQVN